MEADEEVEAIADDYLDDLLVAERKVCDRVTEIVRRHPELKDEIIYLLARTAGSDIAMAADKGMRKRLDKAERTEAQADLIRKYMGVARS